MDALWLSRLQFALTAGFHFIFPPLTIGLAWLIFWFMTRYKRTGDDFYRRLARFWIRIFAVSFVVGVATGITMEFQFGTNWSQYSRYVGDIFGAPLAAEGVLSFFLESTFLAVLVLGWDKVSVRVHWFSSLMVALGATLSAFWIIVANSWQQTPAGFHIANGRAELTSFWAAAFNPSMAVRFLHTVDGALITGAFFMLGISAWYLLKGRHVECAKASLKLSLIVAFVASFIELGLGDAHGKQIAKYQPAKLAAMEALFQTQKGAPEVVIGIPDAKAKTVHAAIKVPGLLSLMAFGSAGAEVKGLDAFDEKDWPPVGICFFSFRAMLGLGMYFIAFSAFGVLLLLMKKAYTNRLFLSLAALTIPLPFLANELGWVTAEVGRQPWIVYNLLRTSEGYSATVPAVQVLISIIMFTAVYALLFAAWIFLLRKEVGRGPEEDASTQKKEAQT